ncbi:hypothetical protein ACQ4PT_013413 [Festuca glaucescens]
MQERRSRSELPGFVAHGTSSVAVGHEVGQQIDVLLLPLSLEIMELSKCEILYYCILLLTPARSDRPCVSSPSSKPSCVSELRQLRREHEPPDLPDLPLLDSSRAEMEVGGADLRSSIKKWKIIYPVYLNSKKTVAEGRRIAAAKACPDPTCIEIADSCAFLKIPRAIELDKAYPRDFFQVGRVRVQLTNDDGSPVNPAIRTKKQLMIQIAELVPKHHGRTKKQEPAAGPSVVSTNNKKKNKNKK